MAETNGHRDNESRLDRIEIAIEHIVNEHEKLVGEHGFLLKAQVVMVDSIVKLSGAVERLSTRVAEIGGKLDALIHVVDLDHKEFHARLARLESGSF